MFFHDTISKFSQMLTMLTMLIETSQKPPTMNPPKHAKQLCWKPYIPYINVTNQPLRISSFQKNNHNDSSVFFSGDLGDLVPALGP
jgi:hypothetical protein